MKTVEVDYDTIHKIVDSNRNLHWDGWSVVETKRDADAIFTKSAMFRDGQWLRVTRTTNVSQNGTWKVPQKYVMAK